MDTQPPGRKFKPESLMMSYGYKPELSEGAVKCPIFLTSTFVFRSAEEGKRFFEIAYGQREQGPTEELGLIYSRLNNPDLEILEDRLKLWDEADGAAVFESGLAAITTVLLEFLSPGDLLLFSSPLYGGTHHFIHHVLTRFGVRVTPFLPTDGEEDLARRVEQAGGGLAMVYCETPANPTNAQIDLEMVVRVARRFSTPGRAVVTAVDNTYMGPMWQKPLRFGIDVCVYSATKFIAGHSDLIAGSATGSHEMIGRIKTLRTFLGNMASPHTGWLLMRSLETLKIRTDRQAANAAKVAAFLRQHPKIEKVYYLGQLEPGTAGHALWQRQCSCAGSMISFDVQGGESGAFQLLNALKMVRLAVSLGSTESLAEHPATMTHSDVPPDEREALGITGSLVRLSVGVEDPDDLIWDFEQALAKVG